MLSRAIKAGDAGRRDKRRRRWRKGKMECEGEKGGSKKEGGEAAGP